MFRHCDVSSSNRRRLGSKRVTGRTLYALLKTSTVRFGTRDRGGGGGGEGGGGGGAGGGLGGIDDGAYENIEGGAVGVVEVTVPSGFEICARHEQGPGISGQASAQGRQKGSRVTLELAKECECTTMPPQQPDVQEILDRSMWCRPDSCLDP